MGKHLKDVLLEQHLKKAFLASNSFITVLQGYPCKKWNQQNATIRFMACRKTYFSGEAILKPRTRSIRVEVVERGGMRRERNKLENLLRSRVNSAN